MMQPMTGTTFLLDKNKCRAKCFARLHPKKVSSPASMRAALHSADKNSLWLSYDKGLTDLLLKSVHWPASPLGDALLVHKPTPESIPTLRNCFGHVAFSMRGGFLPPAELAEVLLADNREDLFIGGTIGRETQTLTLWRGDLKSLTTPFSAFPTSGDGTEPDFSRFAVTDYGHTIRLGKYEAATDAILYEFDPEYGRRIAGERSFGAPLRRLRKRTPTSFAPRR